MMDPFSSTNASNYSSLHAGVSDEKYNEYAAGHDHIAKNIAGLMNGGHGIESTEVQHWIGKHYEYVCQFWVPNRIAYKSLALTYTLDPAFKATYEAYEIGLASFIQKAINLWADQNLNDTEAERT
jgi:hypothetical protein